MVLKFHITTKLCQIIQIIQKKIIQLTIKSNQIILTFKKNVDLKLLQMNFQNGSILFKDVKPFLVNDLYSEATTPRVHNSNNIIAFSDNIASFTRNIRSNVDNHLKEGRARLKYFPGVTSNDLLFYIEPTLGGGQFDTAII